MLRASVIIPTYNKLPRLKLVLYSIECQMIDRDMFEVIVVDDGSDDGTKEYLFKCNFSYSMKVIEGDNAGRACARNKGIKAANNEIMIFIDDDTVLGPNFIMNHLKAQNEGLAVIHGWIRENSYVKFFYDPCEGVLYPYLQKSGNTDQLRKCCVRYEDIKNGCEKLDTESKVSAHEKIVNKVFERNIKNWYWIGFCGGNTSISKEWVLETGGFDEQYGLNWGCEDMDFGYQLMIRKYPFKMCCEALNYHLDHLRKNYVEEHKRNLDIFYGKYQDETIHIFGKFVSGEYKSRDVIAMLINNCEGYGVQ